MYILDRDVLSSLDGSHRNVGVDEWYATVDETDIYLCAVTIYEMSKNIARLKKKHKAADARRAEDNIKKIKTIFAGRILSLDPEAAEDWGRMIGEIEKHIFDVGRAAIAKQHGYIVVTGNTKDYHGRGATTLDPFKRVSAH